VYHSQAIMDQVPGCPARPSACAVAGHLRRRNANAQGCRLRQGAPRRPRRHRADRGRRPRRADEDALRTRGIYDLAWTATFSEDEATVEAARWIVWEASQAVGARSASIQELYNARSRGEYEGMTVPAINLRAQTFDMARVILETAKKNDSAAVIFELARSEQTYTFQRVFEYATSVLAGAIAAGWKGPVFIQGDHYQFNAKKYAADAEKMTEEIRKGCRDAIAAGYRNIDIDSSTLVDLSFPTLDEQQHENYMRAAELTALIRSLEVDGVTVSVGGEIGEVGKKNSTPDELKAYLDGYRRELDSAGEGRDRPVEGLRPDRHQPRRHSAGRAAAWPTVALDFNVLTELSNGRPRVRPVGRGPARRQHAAGRHVPQVPRHRLRRDPPRHRLPERPVRAPGLPGRDAQGDRGVGLRQLPGRAQAGPDGHRSSSTPAARRRSARSSASCGTCRPRT
jgi:hypothetical protein